ncbi:hypothetical protein PY365_21245 [Roseiarcaceae bacterium H3SJ34-1]|uniref:hypothetical protein n=1 Tax=Terripilifer ovatus TaxID=3032367 RepID=UPI003AB92B46|nr:hypothetical protein [Roseiarcaceae bacterium H3SJ34-1]
MVVTMKELHINPNRPRDSHEETSWLERDQAAIHHLDFEDSPEAPVNGQAAPPAPDSPEPMPPDVEPIIEPKRAAQPDHRPAAEAPSPHMHQPPDAPAVAETVLPGTLPPLLAALLTTLPRPGAVWGQTERMDWLRAAEDIFHLVYKTEGRIRIEPRE